MYRTVLIVLALLLLLPGAVFPAGRSMCLSCHRPHHPERESCTGCHRGDDRTGRKEIAHHDLIAGRYAHFMLKESPVVARGKALIDGLACRRCHVYEKKGNRLASDLGSLVRDVAPQALSDSIRSPVQFMPNFHLYETQIGALVNALLAGAKAADGKVQETPQVVHFEDERLREENIFVKYCGPCHSALSERFGGVGAGAVGPNLSGLFSRFYPSTLNDGGWWDPGRLQKWLENPRKIRPVARMQPVRLAAAEFDLLISTLRIDPAAKKAAAKLIKTEHVHRIPGNEPFRVPVLLRFVAFFLTKPGFVGINADQESFARTDRPPDRVAGKPCGAREIAKEPALMYRPRTKDPGFPDMTKDGMFDLL